MKVLLNSRLGQYTASTVEFFKHGLLVVLTTKVMEKSSPDGEDENDHFEEEERNANAQSVMNL